MLSHNSSTGDVDLFPRMERRVAHTTEFRGCAKMAAAATRFRPTSRRTLRVRASRDSPKQTTSQEARLRTEVASPFRVARIFLVGAVGAGAAIGTAVATTQLLASLAQGATQEELLDSGKTLLVDLGGVAFCTWSLRRDWRARDAQIARMEREAQLSQLRLELGNGKTCAAGALRGFHRLVLVAGSQEYLAEAQATAAPYRQELLQRGVMYVPIPMDALQAPPEAGTESTSGNSNGLPSTGDATERGKGTETEPVDVRWKATPLRLEEWRDWVRNQKQLANVPESSGVYVSFRMDGRVRGSGVRLPPWERMAKQLAPTQGMWKGFGDGFDGAV